MILLLVFSLFLKHGLTQEPLKTVRDAVFHDVFPDIFVGKVNPTYHYNDILNILHNDKSNKKLLAKINKRAEYVDPWKGIGDRTSDLIIVRDERDVGDEKTGLERAGNVDNNIEMNTKIRSAVEYTELNINSNKRVKRCTESSSNSAEYCDNDNDAKNVSSVRDSKEKDSERKKRSVENPISKLIKRLKRDSVINENVESLNEETIRARRASAIKMLQNLVGKSEPEKAKPRSAFSMLRYSNEINATKPFTDVIANLTSSIERLNQNLVDLKITSKDQGYVIIKIPKPNEDSQKNSRKKREVENVESTTVLYDTETEERKSTGDANVEEKRYVTDLKPAQDVNVEEIIYLNDLKPEQDKNVEERRYLIDLKPVQNVNGEEIRYLNGLKPAQDVNVEEIRYLTDFKPTQDFEYEDVPENITERPAEEDNNENDLTRKLEEGNVINLNKEIYTSTMETPIDRTENITEEIKSRDGDEAVIITVQNEDNLMSSSKPIGRTTLDLRQSLVEYIEHIFQEIKAKIHPINFVKQQFSADNMYKIGYIVATIDSVNMTIKSLNKKLDANKGKWPIKKLKQVLRKLDLSKDLLDDVLNNLGNYVVAF